MFCYSLKTTPVLTVQEPVDPYHASLCARITHPDILSRILTFIPATHLPAVLRVSRDLHALAGPLLYRDLSLPLSGLALPPHISPIGCLLDRAACSSPADQHALLSQSSFVTRQRGLLQSARTLRLGYHSHHVLPRIMRDLVLDMSRVDVLHLEGSAVCHHDRCPTLRNLRPKVISIEAMSLDAVARPLREMDVRGVSGMQLVEHVVIRLRPTSLGVFPKSHMGDESGDIVVPVPSNPKPRRLTIVLAPNTYLDGTGCTIHQPWRPSRFSPCGSSGSSRTSGNGVAQPTTKPSFCDFVQHVADACVRGQWEQVTLVGAETIDESWVRGCVKEHRWRCEKEAQHQQGGIRGAIPCDGKGCMSVSEVVRRQVKKEICDVSDRLAQEGMSVSDQDVVFTNRKQWDEGGDGYLLEESEIGMGYKGKGKSSAGRPVLPKSHSM